MSSSKTRVFAISLVLALLINALVAVGAAIAAIDTARADLGPADLIVWGSGALNPADFSAVAHQLGADASLGPIVSGMEPVSTPTRRLQVLVQGVPANYQDITSWETDQGRFFTDQDDASLTPVAVIDEGMAQQMFPGGDAVGSTLDIGDTPFSIVGVGSDPQQENVVLVPFRSAQIRLFGRGVLNGIVLRVSSGTDATSISRATELLLRTRHNLRPGQADDFTISTAPLIATRDSAATPARVLEVLQQFVCPAKDTCPQPG